MNDQESKAVYASLAGAFDDRTIIANAFTYWLKNRSVGELDVIELVEQLNSYLGLGTTEKKALMIGLYNNVKKRIDELPDVPSFLSEGLRETTASETRGNETGQRSSRPVHVQLSEYFMSETLSQIDIRKLDSQELREEIREVGFTLDSGEKIKLEQLSGGLRLSDGLSENDCQDLLHAYYLLMSEILGPVDADLVFQDSMQVLVKSEAAKSYDPRKLIV